MTRCCTYIAGLGALIIVTSGCVAARVGPIAYTPDELRAELARRLPELDPDELIIPHEVTPDLIERGRKFAPRYSGRHKQLLSLVDSLSDRRKFGLSYHWAVTKDAQATLEDGGGNCLALSAVLVALGRPLGLTTYFVDASARMNERREEPEINVTAGHVAVVAYTEHGPTYVDFTGELPRISRLRVMDDLEAVAHFYNNAGYELINRAQRAGDPVPWEQVRTQFERATRVKPSFAPAWNNLGVAHARLGQLDLAERAYRKALERDPDLESARTNLTNLPVVYGLDPNDAAAR